MMRRMKLTFAGKSFLALVDMEYHVIFSADIWHTYNEICAECEDAPKHNNFRDYVDEVLSNGAYYTSPTFAFYNPWESDDFYDFDDDDKENLTGESWTLFIPSIQWYSGDDFFEQLHQLINQCHFKTEAAEALKRNKKNEKISTKYKTVC